MKNWITAVAADAKGEIFELDGYAAVGMAGTRLVPLTVKTTVNMPHGGELMRLPDRRPIVYSVSEDRFEVFQYNPFAPEEPIYPVAGFNSPGFFNTYVTAYQEMPSATVLPLFSYGAAGWAGKGFRTAVIHVDREPRQDLRRMRMADVRKGIAAARKIMPKNRLRRHLENCALTYGCPAGKNFFLNRYEAPLPTATACNAECIGCISRQNHPDIPCSQNRIDFTPTPDEIAEVALCHIKRVPQAVVSFGQGCEGDPLTAVNVIEPAIRKIRRNTPAGTINMNTNGSRPDVLDDLFKAGLDSVRISMNSVREPCYDAYFRPRGYGFQDVCRSIGLALDRKKFVSVNYLNCPGFTDTPQEFEALRDLLTSLPVNMIQWRNLNFDPLRYWEIMETVTPHGVPLGMKTIFNRIRREFPRLRHGYFNPPKEKVDMR